VLDIFDKSDVDSECAAALELCKGSKLERRERGVPEFDVRGGSGSATMELSDASNRCNLEGDDGASDSLFMGGMALFPQFPRSECCGIPLNLK
jgi:hypothetical protein